MYQILLMKPQAKIIFNLPWFNWHQGRIKGYCRPKAVY